jgi:acid phosphatase type 7
MCSTVAPRVAVAIVALIAAACGDEGGRAAAPTTAPATVASPSVPPASAPPVTILPSVLVAAGDIAACGSDGDEATAAVLDGFADATVATLGDNVYESGTAAEFARCYGPSWGRHTARTRPAPGNHDYATARASGYFGWFGAAAGDPAAGWYSYDLGSWHVVVLNSNCGAVGCGAGGAQERWLRADLAGSSAACTLAYWHHPRFSSGSTHGSTGEMAPLWNALHELGADVVLAGHEHHYERFAPLDAAGRVDPERGIRSFVVGTGGRSHYGFAAALPGSEVRHSGTYGVLALTLARGGYDWRFVPEAGRSFSDAGSGRCH